MPKKKNIILTIEIYYYDISIKFALCLCVLFHIIYNEIIGFNCREKSKSERQKSESILNRRIS